LHCVADYADHTPHVNINLTRNPTCRKKRTHAPNNFTFANRANAKQKQNTRNQIQLSQLTKFFGDVIMRAKERQKHTNLIPYSTKTHRNVSTINAKHTVLNHIQLTKFFGDVIMRAKERQAALALLGDVGEGKNEAPADMRNAPPVNPFVAIIKVY
jgi:hypothetical protein